LADEQSTKIRLQKVLAEAGVGSRRECEELISDGRVDVDREIVTQLGTKVDPGSQAIRVDGVALKRKKRRYFAVHKPPGILSTSKDPWGRARVIDLVAAKERLFTIGRLDKESSGLILVTNDGDLANQITHPRYQVEKTYQVTVAGVPKMEVIQKLRHGVVLADGRVKPESVLLKKRLKQSALLEIVLTEGRNREIRRMLARFEHKVLKLKRISIGTIRLGPLPSGAHRELTRAEVNRLRALITDENKKVAPKKPRRSAGKGSKATKKKTVRSKATKMDLSTRGPKTGAIIGGSAGPAEKPKSAKGSTKRPTKKPTVKKASGGKGRATKKSKGPATRGKKKTGRRR